MPSKARGSGLTKRFSRFILDQGGVVSPVLANLFLHYVFDDFMVRRFPSIRWERYTDDDIAMGEYERSKPGEIVIHDRNLFAH